MDQLQGLKPPYRTKPRAATRPRRAFEVTCAIRFSKSVIVQRFFRRKKRTRNLLSAGREVNRKSREVHPCGKRKIGGVLRPVNPPQATGGSNRWSRRGFCPRNVLPANAIGRNTLRPDYSGR